MSSNGLNQFSPWVSSIVITYNNGVSVEVIFTSEIKNCTLTFPASLMAEMILSWSANCKYPTVEITTSTCFIASTKLLWSNRSPCIYYKPIPWNTVTHPSKSKSSDFTYENKIDTQGLEFFDDGWFVWVGKSGLADKNEGWVASLGARFHDELPDVASASDEENLARHRKNTRRC